MTEEFTIQKSPGAGPAQLIMVGLVVLFSCLAALNLSRHTATVASTIWLGLLGILTAGGLITERGPWGLAKALLSGFAHREFAFFKTLDGATPAICFGFEWHGSRFIQRTIPIHRIVSIEWSPGQATAMTGRDMGDWSVFLRIAPENPPRHRPKKHLINPTLDVLAVGPPRAKEITEAFGASFIAFLKEHGVHLTPGDQSNLFVPSNR